MAALYMLMLKRASCDVKFAVGRVVQCRVPLYVPAIDALQIISGLHSPRLYGVRHLHDGNGDESYKTTQFDIKGQP